MSACTANSSCHSTCIANSHCMYVGFMHSLFYFNSTLSDNDISMLAMVTPLVHTQTDCRCPPKHPVTRETVCEEASVDSEVARVNIDTHHPSLINDDNFTTWWQGELRVAPVNVTISLDGLRAALTVVIYFRSARPQSMVIHYSSDNGASFSPRQYYSANCSRFGMADNGLLRTARDVNCVTFESSSLQNQVVNFSVLDIGNRPEADDYVRSSSLQTFARATHIRLELVELNDVAPTNQYYFAIDEVVVNGQECLCNGHADTCQAGSTCICQHNTMGTNCEQCLPLFNNKPWAPGTDSSANQCEACECNNHAESCVYNSISNSGVCVNCTNDTQGDQCQFTRVNGQDCQCNGHANICRGSTCICQHNTMGTNCEQCLPLFNNKHWEPGTNSSANQCEACECNNHAESCVYSSTSNSGVCVDCAENTQGEQCQLCLPYFYNSLGVPIDSPDPCLPCDCDSSGVIDGGSCVSQGSNAGQCSCKSFVTGRQCDTCQDGYYSMSASNPDGCSSCECDTRGTAGRSETCDMDSGQCSCKPNFTGRQCQNGYYNTSAMSAISVCLSVCLSIFLL